MANFLIKIFCFLRGHDWLTMYSLNNAATFDGIPRSSWGEHKCMRCDKTKSWQFPSYKKSP